MPYKAIRRAESALYTWSFFLGQKATTLLLESEPVALSAAADIHNLYHTFLYAPTSKSLLLQLCDDPE
jgi:hypothetical protein